MQDLHLLPKLRDSLSYLYIEHAVIERDNAALLVLQETGRTTVPIANLCLLLLGPGTSLTHAAVVLLAENGTSVVWAGQDGNKFYAQGNGETRRATHLLRQATLVCDPAARLRVVMRMYALRFGYELDPGLTIDQIRGMEGARVKNVYAEASRKYGVAWQGRNYDRSNWTNADPANRALSAANALLNGICHAAIVSGGYAPGLGFLHTGLQLSFVYDIADLYKTQYSIPAAFYTAAQGPDNIERRTRETCRELFREQKLLHKILPDIDRLLEGNDRADYHLLDQDLSLPVDWWQPTETGGE
ncbi:MAG: type I-E CRISPR-associated endonuclease Cas1e [Anaerolineaceae bacterium]|jgi:CRISPR-associated protein Cas1